MFIHQVFPALIIWIIKNCSSFLNDSNPSVPSWLSLSNHFLPLQSHDENIKVYCIDAIALLTLLVVTNRSGAALVLVTKVAFRFRGYILWTIFWRERNLVLETIKISIVVLSVRVYIATFHIVV